MSDVNGSAPQDLTPQDVTQPLPVEDIPTADPTPVDVSPDAQPVDVPPTEENVPETAPVPTEEPAVDASPEQPASELPTEVDSSSTDSDDTDGTSETTSPLVETTPVDVIPETSNSFPDPIEIEPDTSDIPSTPVSNIPLPDGVSGAIVGTPALSAEEIEARFGFHKATIEGPEASAAKHSGLRGAFKEFATYMATVLPGSRETALALTHLEEASMWSHKAIAKVDPLEDEPVYVVAGQDAERILTNVTALRSKGQIDDITQNLLVELGLS